VTVAGIRSVSGTPIHECISMLLPELIPIDEGALARIADRQKEAVQADGGRLYPGVGAGLERLAGHHRLYLVSNCPDWYLEAFFGFSGLRHHFSGWDCHGSSGLSKADMLIRLAAEEHLEAPMYVGDTHWDGEAAEAAGMAFVFVRYGFGRAEGAAMSVDTFADLEEALSR
jgi:phosphoglycolate phosphatase